MASVEKPRTRRSSYSAWIAVRLRGAFAVIELIGAFLRMITHGQRLFQSIVIVVIVVVDFMNGWLRMTGHTEWKTIDVRRTYLQRKYWFRSRHGQGFFGAFCAERCKARGHRLASTYLRYRERVAVCLLLNLYESDFRRVENARPIDRFAARV